MCVLIGLFADIYEQEQTAWKSQHRARDTCRRLTLSDASGCKGMYFTRHLIICHSDCLACDQLVILR